MLNKTNRSSNSQLQKIDNFVKSLELKIDHNTSFITGTLPFYDRTSGQINISKKENYPNEREYFLELFHEIGHWTGDTIRLDRDSLEQYDGNSQNMIFEEMIAESFSALCLFHFNFDKRLNVKKTN